MNEFSKFQFRKMSLPRRLTAQAALQMLLNMSDSENEDEMDETEDEAYNEVGGDGDIERGDEGGYEDNGDEDDGDIEIVSEQSGTDESDEEDQTPVRTQPHFTNALGVNYRREPFPSRRRQRNIVQGSIGALLIL